MGRSFRGRVRASIIGARDGPIHPMRAARLWVDMKSYEDGSAVALGDGRRRRVTFPIAFGLILCTRRDMLARSFTYRRDAWHGLLSHRSRHPTTAALAAIAGNVTTRRANAAASAYLAMTHAPIEYHLPGSCAPGSRSSRTSTQRRIRSRPRRPCGSSVPPAHPLHYHRDWHTTPVLCVTADFPADVR